MVTCWQSLKQRLFESAIKISVSSQLGDKKYPREEFFATLLLGAGRKGLMIDEWIVQNISARYIHMSVLYQIHRFFHMLRKRFGFI